MKLMIKRSALIILSISIATAVAIGLGGLWFFVESREAERNISSGDELFADWTIQEDNWYSITIDGVKSGWTHETIEVESDTNNVKTVKIQEMTLSRGGIEISISVTTTFIETADGKPITVQSTQETTGQIQELLWRFNDSSIEMTSVAGGEPIVKIIPMPEGHWLTPHTVRRMFEKKMKEGASAITYQTIIPELGPSLLTVVMTRQGEEVQDVLGSEQTVISWETVNDKMPIVGTEFYTADGKNVGSSMNAGFGTIATTIMSKHEALSPINEVPEFMVTFFVEPNRAIPNDPTLKQLILHVRSKDGSVLELPTAGFQTAIKNEDGTVTLVLDLDTPIAATPEELEDENYLSASSLCDGNDEAVVTIAKNAIATLPADASELDIAFALRSKVFDYIDEKGMSTAFASASQTARDRKGDCSEHGVLLCGLLRASGIPSRGVMGMVYVPNYGAPNGVFGWHMWSQALIDGKWIDLDATLRTPFSVGHIATLTTSLSDEGIAAEMGGILATIGNLDVDVVQVGDKK